MLLKFIKKWNNEMVEFDIQLIKWSILNAYQSVGNSNIEEIDNIVWEVLKFLKDIESSLKKDELITSEQVEWAIEKSFIKFNKYGEYKAFIIEEEKHRIERTQEDKDRLEKLNDNKITVKKSSWNVEVFNMGKIRNVYGRLSLDLRDMCPFIELEHKLKNYIVDWLKTSDITQLIIKSAVDLISVECVSWQFVAWRFYLFDLYKKASKNRLFSLDSIYDPELYTKLFDDYIEKWLYYKDFYKYYSKEDILIAWKELDIEQDFEYNYTTILMYNKRYLLNPNKNVMELPQEMYMSVALFLAIPEPDEKRLQVAIKIYKYTSSQKISLPTPTLMNARTNFYQLSSCFKLSIDDDLRSIYHNVENMAQISKFWGWVWVYIWHVRSKWSDIRWVKWASGWVTPWIKVINDTAVAVNQLGARAWAVSVTLDIWHKDIYDFLDLQTETWDIRKKSFDVYPAVSIPDLFMKRVQKWEEWTLFDPREVYKISWKKLEKLYWEEFEKLYIQLELDPSIELKEKVNAKDLFKKFLKSVVETWMPYTFFRDIANRLNPNKHAWMIYSSQLCAEIAQNTSVSEFMEETEENGEVSIKYKAGDTVICNLASINVAKVNKDDDIEAIIPITMRILDNVVSLNYYPIQEAKFTAQKYRSVWVWFMWLSEYLATNKYIYDSEDARKHVDQLFEKYAYHVLKSSNNLAKERWKYELFDGSDWSKWILIWKDKDWFKENSEFHNEWSELIDNIQKDWLRFAYHMSPAPNTSTSLVVGTTAWLLPIYKKYFVETNSIAPTVNVAPKLSKENFWYYKEYVHMNMPDVINMIATINKRIDQSSSFEWIINPMNVSPSDLYAYYMQSWEQWIKTIYYVRSMSLDVNECVSCSW